MVEDTPKKWWYDTCATTHICVDREMFSTYQKSKTNDQVKMGNISQSKIEVTLKVLLKMSYGLEVILTNMKHVPDTRKNIISGSLMSKHGFRINFESDQLIFRKSDVFIRNDFVKNGLVKISIIVIQKNDLQNSNISKNKSHIDYVVESSNIWHERLRHVNYKSVQRLMNMKMIPKSKINKDKCEVCVQTKLTKTPSPHVERTTELLTLISSL